MDTPRSSRWWLARTTAAVMLAAFAVIGGLLIVVFGASEPAAQGRPLSSWLVEVDYNQPAAARERASKAIQEIGTNALPYLLRDLDPREQSPLKERLIALLRKQTFIKLRLRTADERSRQATWAFKALGPTAEPAIPKLIPLVEKNPGYVPGALAGIGPKAIPHLCQALENSHPFVRGNTAAYLANAVWDLSIPKSNALSAVPLLVKNLKDTNHLVRWHSASALGAIVGKSELAVPALIEALEDPDAAVAEAAARALAPFGSRAKPAVPALRRASEHNDTRVSAAAAAALKQIDR